MLGRVRPSCLQATSGFPHFFALTSSFKCDEQWGPCVVDSGSRKFGDMASEAFVKIMDDGAARILSRAERAYDVDLEIASQLSNLISTSDEVSSTGGAYVLWAEITDLVDDPMGPNSDEMCAAFSVVLARAWQQLSDRHDERVQTKFVRRWAKSLKRYWRKGKLPV